MKKIIAIAAATLLLTSCGGISGVATGEPDIDFNADVEAIGLGMKKFEANSSTSGTIKTLEDFRVITENNGAILDEIEAATQSFLSDIERASSRLPVNDSVESPSKSKLLAWAEGYKSWVYFQKQNQVLGEECLSQTSEWMNCLITNLPYTMQNESSSTIKLTAAIQGIQEWRKLAGQ
jgi:hypothetical protein